MHSKISHRTSGQISQQNLIHSLTDYSRMQSKRREKPMLSFSHNYCQAHRRCENELITKDLKADLFRKTKVTQIVTKPVEEQKSGKENPIGRRASQIHDGIDEGQMKNV